MTAPAATDRCDRCGAAPKFQVILPSGSDLLFCGHHGWVYAKHLSDRYPVLPIDSRS